MSQLYGDEIAIVTDTHFGARDDVEPIKTNQRRFLMEVMYPEMRKRNCKTLIHLGDLSDRRKYSKNMTAHFVNEVFFDPLQEMGVDCHILVGNHDTQQKDTNKYHSITLATAGRPNWTVYEDATEVRFGECPVLFLPWICKENKRRSLSRIEKSNAMVAMAHLGFTGFPIGDNDRDAISAQLVEKFDCVFSGHYHDFNSKGNIYYLGATNQLTWGDAPPRGFHFWSPTKQMQAKPGVETGLTDHIINPYSIFNELFYNDEKLTLKQMLAQAAQVNVEDTYVRINVDHVKKPSDLDAYISAIENRGPHDLKINQNHAMEQESEIEGGRIVREEDMLNLLIELAEKQSFPGVDQKQLAEILTNAYHAANKHGVIDSL